MAPFSEAKIRMVNQVLTFQLRACSMHYSVKDANSVKFVIGNQPLTLTQLVGDSTFGNCHTTQGWWTKGREIGVAGAGVGTAAAVAIGLETANPSPSK